MFTLICENKYGDQIELTHNEAYDIVEIIGFDPPEATINTTRNAGADGSVYNSSYVNERQITITLVVNAPAEANRINLYKYFKTKFPVRLYYKNETRDVYIDGFVKDVDVGYFDKKQTIQIVIFCPKPMLNANSEDVQDFITVESLFEFPFAIEEAGIPFSEILPYVEKSIINSGDVDTGALIHIKAIGSVVNPKIYDLDTGEHIFINITMAEGDEIIINTHKAEKSVTLVSSGVKTNIIGKFANGSTWFTLIPGDNLFTIGADNYAENMLVTFVVFDQYEGV